MIPFSDTVKMLRQERGLTLEAVAEKLGSHKGYVSGIENKKVNPPSAKIVVKYAKLFHKSEAELLFKAWEEKAPKVVQDRYELFEQLEMAVQKYKALTDSPAERTEPQEHGDKDHAQAMRQAWGKVTEILTKLKTQFGPPANGNGNGHAKN